MLSQYGFQMFNDQFTGKTNLLSLQYQITGANTFSPLPASFGSAVLLAIGNTGFSAQATIDDFLYTTSEFNYLALNSTSVPTDSVGGVIKMNGINDIVQTSGYPGQCKSVQAMVVSLFASTNLATATFTAAVGGTSLTNNSATTAIAVGSFGDIAFKATMASGFSSLTAGMFQVDIYWTSV